MALSRPGGKGAYAAVDCVGGEGTVAVTRSLREHGTLLVWGFMAGFVTSMFLPDFVFRFIQVCCCSPVPADKESQYHLQPTAARDLNLADQRLTRDAA